MKEVTLQRLYAEWFQLHVILDRENYENSKWPMMSDRKMGEYTQMKDRESSEGKLFSMIGQW